MEQQLHAPPEDLERFRGHVFVPEEMPEHPETVFTEEEQGWLDSNPSIYDLRYIRLWVAAINKWARIAVEVEDRELPWRTPAEMLAGASETFDAVIADLAYRGMRTLVVGQSKAGKSYFTWAQSAAAVRAGLRVLYLSEEPLAAVNDKLRTFNLEEAGDLFLVVRKSAVFNLQWKDVCAQLEKAVTARAFDLVIVDTARPWFGLTHDEGNSADAVGHALDLLSQACGDMAAVVVLHQAPWDKGRARGSTEFHAAVDLIFGVNGQGKTPRTIKYVGGRIDSIPEQRSFRWADGHGEDLGVIKRREKAENLDKVLRVLEEAEDPLTADTIADGAELHVRTVQRTLADLDKLNKVVRTKGRVLGKGGHGGGGEPDRWSRRGIDFEELLGATDRES